MVPPAGQIVVVLLVGLGVSPVFAGAGQPDGALDTGECFNLGRVQLRPFVGAEYGYDDNILSVGEEAAEELGRQVLADNYLLVESEFAFRLPFSQSYVELNIRPTYLEYAQFELDQNLTHGADAVVQLASGSGMELEFEQSYDRGFIRAEDLDPGGETVFRAQKYERHRTTVDFYRESNDSMELGARGRYTDVVFDRQSAPGLFDYQTGELQAFVGRELGRDLLLEATGEASLTRRERPVPLPGVGDINQTQALDYYGLGLGVRRRGTQTDVLAGSLSLTHVESSRARDVTSPETLTPTSTFTGVTGEFEWVRSAPSGQRRSLVLSYGPLQSFFFNSSYYLSTRIRFAFRYRLVGRYFFDANLGYFYNAYAEALDARQAPAAYEPYDGVLRVDRLLNARIGLDIQLLHGVALGLGVQYTERQSNISLQEFDAFRTIIGLELGWP